MTATDAQIAQVRRMAAEPTTDTYSDDLIADYIERYPHIDEQGERPYTLSSDAPPIQVANTNWIPTYDLHAAAADIWEEKAAVPAQDFDFSEDNIGSYKRSQVYEQYMKQCRFHRARRMPSTTALVKDPEETKSLPWIANLPEED
jgi:hypothetical protein